MWTPASIWITKHLLYLVGSVLRIDWAEKQAMHAKKAQNLRILGMSLWIHKFSSSFWPRIKILRNVSIHLALWKYSLFDEMIAST